jgi:hypothetical protein
MNLKISIMKNLKLIGQNTIITMKKLQLLLTVCLVCFFATNIFAQEEDKQLVTQANISLLYPGFSIETPLSEKITIFGKVGLGLGLAATDFPDGEFQVSYGIVPAYNVQGRYYYTGVKSETRKGKSLFSNSGNYVFAQVAGNFAPIATNADTNGFLASDYTVHGVGLGWGFQRTYKNNFLISWGIGVGYETTQRVNMISEFTLGIALNKK